MQEQKTWQMLLKHLAGDETNEEKELFSKWLKKKEENEVLFCKVQSLWDGDDIVGGAFKQKASLTFLGRFTKKKIKNFVLNQALGNLVGFMIGMWVTAMFSHYVLEKRGLKNLFGITGRKKVAVNEIPEWLQSGIAILVGFIALELINHFFQTKRHLLVWEYFKGLYNKIKERNRNDGN